MQKCASGELLLSLPMFWNNASFLASESCYVLDLGTLSSASSIRTFRRLYFAMLYLLTLRIEKLKTQTLVKMEKTCTGTYLNAV